MAEQSEVNEQCCTLPPFKSDYVPVGKRFTLQIEGQDDLEVYETGDPDAKQALVAIHDIFGLHSNTLQGADYLAQLRGYRIVIPDFFRGKGWDINDIPPKAGRPALNAWVQEVGSWEKVQPGLIATVENARRLGAASIGAYGFCFGAKKLVQGAHLKLFKCMGFIHPTNFQPEDADNVDVPIALLPSQGEDPKAMDAFYGKIQTKPIADASVRQDFLDVHHGFASARSNWADPKLANRAREAYQVLDAFFQRNL
ncbi:alpha/beta-hydrolase [Rhizodiscina lignyota]|uniref:Alpha/beta-hydrolase n=1 Tax=Rhizodiscina lignyota TaxID=1504668 RepID=A0A9P4IR00_9PEZI|nr:alpha/beta-hydrolase [Rhizodiscina lignyota]